MIVAGGCLALVLAGCAGAPPATAEPAGSNRQSPPPGPSPPDRARLGALAAAAKDRRYVATYVFTVTPGDDRTVTVAVAIDGSWVVAVPRGALGGLADIAIYGSSAGLFQCALGPAAGSSQIRPELPPVTAGCARVAELTASTDPRVQHVFTDWIDAMIDRAAALSVVAAPTLAGSRGSCFSVESSSVALPPPMDPGIYCFDLDGTLTAARLGFGTLMLTATASAPATVTMPGPVVDRPPLPLAAAPPSQSQSAGVASPPPG